MFLPKLVFTLKQYLVAIGCQSLWQECVGQSISLGKHGISVSKVLNDFYLAPSNIQILFIPYMVIIKTYFWTLAKFSEKEISLKGLKSSKTNFWEYHIVHPDLAKGLQGKHINMSYMMLLHCYVPGAGKLESFPRSRKHFSTLTS